MGEDNDDDGDSYCNRQKSRLTRGAPKLYSRCFRTWALELFDLTDGENDDDGDDEKVKAVLLQHEKVQMGKRRKKGLELVVRTILPKKSHIWTEVRPSPL